MINDIYCRQLLLKENTFDFEADAFDWMVEGEVDNRESTCYLRYVYGALPVNYNQT